MVWKNKTKRAFLVELKPHKWNKQKTKTHLETALGAERNGRGN